MLNSLAVLTELVEGAAKPNCGYLIDAYHFTRSGAGGRGFESVPADEIYCFQYSDLSANPVTGVRRPTDRLPPGKGVVKWREMLGLLAEKGYTGYLSYEAPEPECNRRARRFLTRRAKVSNLRISYRGTRSRVMSVEVNHGSRTGISAFSGLNDKSITDIPKTVEKQRYMTSVAPKRRRIRANGSSSHGCRSRQASMPSSSARARFIRSRATPNIGWIRTSIRFLIPNPERGR